MCSTLPKFSRGDAGASSSSLFCGGEKLRIPRMACQPRIFERPTTIATVSVVIPSGRKVYASERTMTGRLG